MTPEELGVIEDRAKRSTLFVTVRCSESGGAYVMFSHAADSPVDEKRSLFIATGGSQSFMAPNATTADVKALAAALREAWTICDALKIAIRALRGEKVWPGDA